MKLEELIQLQVLKLKAAGRGPMLEHALEHGETTLQLRQMCAKVSAELYGDLENVCGILSLTKREFIESAVADALARAWEHIDASGGLEGLGFRAKKEA
jgi:hypothetical protein